MVGQIYSHDFPGNLVDLHPSVTTNQRPSTATITEMSLHDLSERHSSTHTGGDGKGTGTWHWGYGWQTVPCVGVEAYCGYMDLYFNMHDLTMLYTFFLWWVVAGLVLAVGALRFWARRKSAAGTVDVEGRRCGKGGVVKALRASIVAARRRGLRQGFLLGTFKGVTRVQITVLVMVVIYLAIFSFIGGTYNKVIQEATKKRTELGWWSNRVGSLAFALTPLTLILSMRENIFSLITGIPHQHFNFMHRVLGWIIFAQSLLHTIGWTVVQGYFFEPQTQPQYLAIQWKERYYKWGFVAQMLLAFLWVGSLSPVVRRIGHEAFRKSHYVLAVLYLGGCWGHWPEMKEWMIASIVVFFFDRGCRFLRITLIHCGMKSKTAGFGFKYAAAKTVTETDADGTHVVVLRLLAKPLHYVPGQHFFLTFPSITLLQSHPFTPAVVNGHEQVYVIVGMAGETGRLVEAARAGSEGGLPVILCGPYGSPRVIDNGAENFLLVAGGTGVSFTLPLLAALVEKKTAGKLHFVWIIRRLENLAWIRAELLALIDTALNSKLTLQVVIYITRDGEAVAPTLSETDSTHGLEKYAAYGRPMCKEVVAAFRESTAGGGRSQVLASGPAGMGRELRDAVAESNDAAKVWRGQEASDVGLYWDSRYW